ncbi:hypothetical protein B0H14DRAFT_2582923 [Mycena olivaceomarginata]|nr:hypothetical protein B0H14DRAFT_2582923 [Mycena olivaceomarginata]
MIYEKLIRPAACSKAIASRRASIGWPPLFCVWLQKRIAPYPITAPTAAAVGWGNAYGWTTGTVWGTDGVWGNSHRMGPQRWMERHYLRTTDLPGTASPWFPKPTVRKDVSANAGTGGGITIICPLPRLMKPSPDLTSSDVPSAKVWLCTLPQRFSGPWCTPCTYTHIVRYRKQQAGKFTVPDNAAEPRGAFPAAPLSERHGLVPFFLGISRKKRTNKCLPVLAIGSEASEVTLLVISTSLVGGGRHIDCDWNDVMDILSVDILSDERLSLSQIDASFIGPNEVTFGGKLVPVGSVRVLGSS